MRRPATRMLPVAALAMIFALPLHAFEVKMLELPGRITRGNTNVRLQHPIDEAAWIWMPGHVVWGDSADADTWKDDLAGEPGSFFRFRRAFESDGSPLEIHVSADERFVLILDGREVARGPLRGMVEHWYFQSAEIRGLERGPHILEAVCWQLGRAAPIAQLSYRGGFIVRAGGVYDAQLTTGRAKWQVARLAGTRMTDKGKSGTYGVGAQCRVAGTGILDERPGDSDWREAAVVRGPVRPNEFGGRTKGWMLFPADRPHLMHSRKLPGRIVNCPRSLARPFTVAANSELDLWWDLENYYCAYPELVVSGGKGAEIEWSWTESLLDANGRKGNRDEWRGKTFARAMTDVFVADGRDSARFTTPWWRCGRWCRLHLKTGAAALAVNSVAILETRYPLDGSARFESDDPALASILGISRRALENCSHDMVFDCPYYEQQMYPGDTRLQLKFLATQTDDDRLARFAMSIFDWDRRSDGLVAMNFPTRGTQESCTYTMCWIMMMSDYLMEHGDLGFLRERMIGARAALMGLARHEGDDGLLRELPGWSFIDWVRGDSGWECGVPVDARAGSNSVSSLVNLQYLLALESAAAVDAAIGETGFAAVWRDRAARVRDSLRRIFWDDSRGLMADDPAHRRFSEHAQAMAIIANVLAPAECQRTATALESGKGLSPASSYFAYYLFEAFARCGRADLVVRRLEFWRKYLSAGAKTAFEEQSLDSRSDCHGWSACPLYFAHRVFAGVTPSAPGSTRVRVAPQPVGLKHLAASTPTPKGMVETDFHFAADGSVGGRVVLPAGVTGDFIWRGTAAKLHSGTNSVAGSVR